MKPKIAHWIAGLYLVIIAPFITWDQFFVFCGALLFSSIYLFYEAMEWWIDLSRKEVTWRSEGSVLSLEWPLEWEQLPGCADSAITMWIEIEEGR